MCQNGILLSSEEKPEFVKERALPSPKDFAIFSI